MRCWVWNFSRICLKLLKCRDYLVSPANSHRPHYLRPWVTTSYKVRPIPPTPVTRMRCHSRQIMCGSDSKTRYMILSEPRISGYLHISHPQQKHTNHSYSTFTHSLSHLYLLQMMLMLICVPMAFRLWDKRSLP